MLSENLLFMMFVSGFPIEWYKRYGWNTGYICYMLRYFIVLNTGYNLHITPGEFIPLAAMVFCRVDEKWYQSLCILPTLRCITVGNWFQVTLLSL